MIHEFRVTPGGSVDRCEVTRHGVRCSGLVGHVGAHVGFYKANVHGYPDGVLVDVFRLPEHPDKP